MPFFKKKAELDAIDSRINNFPDWLPPMLVKELRQGLRTRGFVLALIASQAVLFLILLGSLSSDSTQAAGQMINVAILVIFGILTLLIQPLRGINAITGDIKSKTLELMQLTRMNSSKLVLGKWISLFTQTLLFGVTLVPYLVLRYLFGGMEIAENGGVLLAMLMFSGFLTAVTVGLSANKSVIIRGLFVVVGFFSLLFYSISSVFRRIFGGSVSSSGPFFYDSWADMGLSALVIIYVSYLFLELGALVIAPVSENRQTRLRAFTVAFIAVCSLLCIATDTAFPSNLSVILIIAIGLLVLSSYLFVTPNTAQKFMAKGPLGVSLGRFFYPGWPAGYLFFLVTSAVLIGLAGTSASFDSEVFLVNYSILGAMALSLILIELITPKTFSRFAFFIIMMISQTFVLFIASLLEAALGLDEVLLFASVVPICQLVALSRVGVHSIETLAFSVNSIYLLAALVLAVRRFSYYRDAENLVTQAQKDSAKK